MEAVLQLKLPRHVNVIKTSGNTGHALLPLSLFDGCHYCLGPVSFLFYIYSVNGASHTGACESASQASLSLNYLQQEKGYQPS